MLTFVIHKILFFFSELFFHENLTLDEISTFHVFSVLFFLTFFTLYEKKKTLSINNSHMSSGSDAKP